MVKVFANRYLSQRIETKRKEVKANTQRLRKKIENLEEIFTVTGKIAKSKNVLESFRMHLFGAKR